MNWAFGLFFKHTYTRPCTYAHEQTWEGEEWQGWEIVYIICNTDEITLSLDPRQVLFEGQA